MVKAHEKYFIVHKESDTRHPYRVETSSGTIEYFAGTRAEAELKITQLEETRTKQPVMKVRKRGIPADIHSGDVVMKLK